MRIAGLGKRVQIFIDEGDNDDGLSRYWTILEKLRAEGAAGATVVRGIAGFGAHSRIHSARLADLVSPLPLVVIWVDAPDRVERLLPAICEMVPEGLVTVEDVEIARFAHRDPGAMGPSLSVGDIMARDVATVRPETPLSDVVELLVGREFRSAPVVRDDGRLIGIVTNSDLVERGGLPARVELLGAMEAVDRRAAVVALPRRTAAQIMTPDPTVIAPEAPVGRAVQLMAERRLKRLPVVDAGGRLVGNLSRVDLLRGLGESYPAPEHAEAAPNPRPVVVGDIMTQYVPVVRETAQLPEVLDVVVSTRLNRAVVVDAGGRVKGVLSDADVLRRLEPGSRPGLLEALMRHARAVPDEAAGVTAAEMVERTAVTATVSTSLAEAAQRMLDARHKVLPIVDEHGVLVGIVDRAHLLAAAARRR